MSAHALYAPSDMARILECPPSALLSAGLPERTNKQADEGTRVHKVVETAVRTRELPPLVPFHANKNMPDREVAGRVLAYINNLGPGSVLTEHRVKLLDNVWGTLDINHIPLRWTVDNIITVFDYKNGGYDVQAKNNKQLLTYAATFLDAYPQVQWFRLVVFQPNSWGAQGEDEQGFKQHVHSRAEVEAHRAKVIEAVAYAGPPKPGPHCRWCNAIPACPVMSQDAAFMMAAISRNPAMLSPQELLRMLRIIRAVHDMEKSLQALLTSALKAGATVDGAKLVSGTKWEQWNDERHAADHLYKAYGSRGVKPLTVSSARKLGSVGAMYASVGSHKPEPELKASY